MTFDITRGGLLVGLAVIGVIVYEFRTVFGFVGVNLPIVPYMLGVFALAALAVWLVIINGGWRTDPGSKDAS